MLFIMKPPKKEVAILGVSNQQKATTLISFIKAESEITEMTYDKFNHILVIYYDPLHSDLDFLCDVCEFMNYSITSEKKEIEAYTDKMKKVRFWYYLNFLSSYIVVILIVYILIGVINGSENDNSIYIILSVMLCLSGIVKWKKYKASLSFISLT